MVKLVLVATVVSTSFEENRWSHVSSQRPATPETSRMSAMQGRLFVRTMNDIIERRRMSASFGRWRAASPATRRLGRRRGSSASEETPSEVSSIEDNPTSPRDYLDSTVLSEQLEPRDSECSEHEEPGKTESAPPSSGVFVESDDAAEKQPHSALSAFVKSFPCTPTNVSPSPSSHEEPRSSQSKLSSFLRSFEQRDAEASASQRNDGASMRDISPLPDDKRRRSSLTSFLSTVAPDGSRRRQSDSFVSELTVESDAESDIDEPSEGSVESLVVESPHQEDGDESDESGVVIVPESSRVAMESPPVKVTPVSTLLALTMRIALRSYGYRSLASRFALWRVTACHERLRQSELGHRERVSELEAKLDDLKQHKSAAREDEVAVVSCSSSIEEGPQTNSHGLEQHQQSWHKPSGSSSGELTPLLFVLKRSRTRQRRLPLRAAWTCWRKLGEGKWYEDEVRLAHRALFETHRERERQLMLRTIMSFRCKQMKRQFIIRAFYRWCMNRSDTPLPQFSRRTRRIRGRTSPAMQRGDSLASAARRRRYRGDDADDDSIDEGPLSDPPLPNRALRSLGRPNRVVLGRTLSKLRRSTLRIALSTLRARCATRALLLERRYKAAALAKVEAADFAAAELREMHAIAKAELEACHKRASHEVDVAWRQAAASDSGHAAQTAAFNAIQEQCHQLAAKFDASNTGKADFETEFRDRLEELERREKELDAEAANQRELETMLIDAKLEIATLKASLA